MLLTFPKNIILCTNDTLVKPSSIKTARDNYELLIFAYYLTLYVHTCMKRWSDHTLVALSVTSITIKYMFKYSKWELSLLE